jgi:hypothetical protein
VLLFRPPLALERLTESSGGQLLYQLRRPWCDGSTALLLDPLEFLERLAALVPAPRRPWLAYHGVLGPHAAWRAFAVPRRVVLRLTIDSMMALIMVIPMGEGIG